MSARYIDLQQDGLDELRIFSVMLYPDDEAKRDEFLACSAVSALLESNEGGEDIALPESVLRVLLRAPGVETVMESASEIGRQGAIAGDVLNFLCELRASDISEPSIRKAIYLEMDYLRDARCGDGKTVGATEPSIRKAWEKYKGVSHFWAALRVCQFGTSTDGLPDIRRLTGEEFLNFLGIAEYFRVFSDDIRPSRSKHPTPPTPDDAWRIPDGYPIQSAPLTHKGLPDWMTERLKTYSKREYDC